MLTTYRRVAVAGEICPGCSDGRVSLARLDDINNQLANASAERTRQQSHEAACGQVQDLIRQIRSTDLSWTPTVPVRDEHAPVDKCSFEPAMQRLRETAAGWATAAAEFEQCLSQVEIAPPASAVRSVINKLEHLRTLQTAATYAVQHADTQRSALRAALATQVPGPDVIQAEYQLAHATTIAKTVINRRSESTRASAHKAVATALKARLTTVIETRFSELAQPINDWLARLAPDHTPPIQVKTRRTAGRTALEIQVGEAR
jgi:hypothetical protein